MSLICVLKYLTSFYPKRRSLKYMSLVRLKTKILMVIKHYPGSFKIIRNLTTMSTLIVKEKDIFEWNFSPLLLPVRKHSFQNQRLDWGYKLFYCKVIIALHLTKQGMYLVKFSITLLSSQYNWDLTYGQK